MIAAVMPMMPSAGYKKAENRLPKSKFLNDFGIARERGKICRCSDIINISLFIEFGWNFRKSDLPDP